VSISGRDYRFRGDYSGFEGAAGRGQFSNTFDDWGNRFINDNSNHIRHTVLPLKYLARNPNLAVANVEEGISDHGGSSVVFPTSKLQERPNDPLRRGAFHLGVLADHLSRRILRARGSRERVLLRTGAQPRPSRPPGSEGRELRREARL
jgi:hypothetical protein